MRLIDIAFRPFKNAKKVLRLMKMIEYVPVVHATPIPKDIEQTKNTATVFTRIDSPNIVLPYDVFKLLEPYIVRLDYDYMGSARHWHLHKDQKLTTQTLHKDDLTAMYVAQKLET